MSHLPPLQRYWPVYAVFLLIFVVLVCLAGMLVCEATKVGSAGGHAKAPSQNVWVLLGGVFVAAAAIAANAWSQWRTASVAHALEAIQTLRTDERYLVNVLVVSSHVTPGTPLTDETLSAFNDTKAPSTIDSPSFRNASVFVLNQYEFIAAGVRSGAVDLHLIDQTVGGIVHDLVTTYEPVIQALRKQNQRLFENLIWLKDKLPER